MATMNIASLSSPWRYIAVLWSLPLVLVASHVAMDLAGSSTAFGLSYRLSLANIVVFLVVFGGTAIWVQRPILDWGRHARHREKLHDVVAEAMMAELPWRALKAYALAGVLYGTYLLLLVSIETSAHQALTFRMLLSMAACFYFGSSVLAPVLGTVNSIHYAARLRRQLSMHDGGFAGDLEDRRPAHEIPGLASRPWTFFVVTGLLPTSLLVIFVFLSMKADNGMEQHFILSQAMVLFASSALAGILIVQTISSTMKLVTRELADGLAYLKQGAFEGRVPVLVDDDLGELSRGLNTALKGLQEREELKDSLKIAADIQKGLLSNLPYVTGYSMTAYQQSCYAVGGDFYDCIELSDGRMWLVVADVAGKGYAAALTVANLQAMLHVLATENVPFDDALAYINKTLYGTLTGGRFVTMFVAKLQPESHSMLWVNAGHVPPLLATASGIEHLNAASPPMGMMPEIELSVHRRDLHRGDTLLAYTDGVIELRNHAGEEMFGARRLSEWFGRHHEAPLEEMQSGLLQELSGFGTVARDDDVTILSFRRGET
ncbi:MAG TPA: PP2C family protein-serine/threonine phosphatase [Mariprofundaceae bacterium]|nr:PP2C family protein-serine/threonine phosphatase [Mariprofundaceae bacterium]